MRYLSLLVLLLPLLVSAQPDTSIRARRTIRPGNFLAVPYPSGRMVIIGRTGVPKALNVDIPEVAGLGEKFALQDVDIRNRTTQLTISSLRATSLNKFMAPATINITDPKKRGLFVLDTSDHTSVDNTGRILRTASGLVYKRWIPGPANAEWYGAVGDASDASAAANTIAIQTAINDVSASANAGADGSSPRNRDRPATLYIPAGTYYTSDELNIPGTILIAGDGGLSYGGTFIFQRSSNKHLFRISGSADGGNSAVQIEDIRLRAYGSSSPSASLIYVDPAAVSANSLYFNRVWFQGWERFALSVGHTDDFQVTNCTFDGATNYCFAIGGDATHVATNTVFDGNTFYGIKGGIGYLGTVEAFSFTHNRVFGANGLHGVNTGFGIDALSPGAVTSRVKIADNTFDHVEHVFATKSDRWEFSRNEVQNTTTRVVEMGGGGLIRYAQVKDNTISGVWSGTVIVGGVAVSDAPIFAAGTGVVHSEITGNILIDAGGSTVAVNVSDPRSHYNEIRNNIDGFTTPNLIANADENLNTRLPRLVYQNVYNTASWTTVGTYNTIVPVGTLANGGAYMLKLYYDQPGTDVITQTFTLPATTTYAGAAAQTTPLTGNAYAYSGNAKLFTVKYLPGGGTVGLTASPSTTGMSGTLTVSIYQLSN